jgi:hypothetical protein
MSILFFVMPFRAADKHILFLIPMAVNLHRDSAFFASRWKFCRIAMEIFFHRDGNFAALCCKFLSHGKALPEAAQSTEQLPEGAEM